MEPPTPIAIVGMACRFSGDVDSPEKLWKMCAEGRSGWSRIPPSRFNLEGVYHEHGDRTGTTNIIGGHFLSEDPAVFDCNFFSLSQETAANMDPQFRMQLETTYEALESAGLTLQDVAGSNTSVFAGAFFRDYGDGLIRDPDALPRLYLPGIGGAMAANRLSHFYDLRGPSMTIDTGCSTSLTTVHQACQSLRAGESTMSIVGGANVILNPDMFAVMSSLLLLSPEGRSFAFDSRANGYGRGEGSATVILKRLDHAIRDGNPIRAVIRETGVNQDGRTETITSPSPLAQQELMRDCYHRAGLDPAQTMYVEAHGTGTPTGDPIEAKAIASTFRGGGRIDLPPLLIGSVKTNIGHTETASGLASVIKLALCLEKGEIPPNLNFKKANPELDFDQLNIQVPTKLLPWPASGGIRRASVNSFGYGGTNAHAIMEDYASYVDSSNRTGCGESLPEKAHTNGDQPLQQNGSRVISLSGKDERGVETMIEALRDYLTTSMGRKDEDRLLDDLAYTLSRGRTRFPCSASLHVTSVSDLISGLSTERMKPFKNNRVPRLGFVFTGQGAQWPGMGRELIENYPVYNASLVDSARILREFDASWDLMDELRREAASSRVNEGFLSMPASVATQIALVDLLRSWGVTCAAVASHSSGEIAAAYATGALAKRAAIIMAYSRGRFNKSGGGSMTAVALGYADAQGYIERITSGRLVVACMNSPTSTTISGDIPALEQLESVLSGQRIFSRRLRVDNAYHSFQMEELRQPYEDWIARYIDEKPPTAHGLGDELDAVFCSPVSGGRISSRATLRDRAHWGRGMVNPVRFSEAFQEMCRPDPKASAQREPGIDMVVEVGPHGALGGPIRDMLGLPEFADYKIPYGTCLVRGSDAMHTLHKLVCGLLDNGYPVDVGSVNFPLGHHGARILHDLPHYPWNHCTRYWSESRFNKALKARKHGHHDLLGFPIPGTNSKSPSWRNIIHQSDLPWIRDHVIQSDIVYPGAGFIAMAVEAALQSCSPGSLHISGYALRDIHLLQALIVPAHPAAAEVHIELRPRTDSTKHSSGWKSFTIHSIDHEHSWTTVCKGLICVHYTECHSQQSDRSIGSVAARLPPPSAPERYRVRLPPKQFYANVRAGGIVHGPSFQNIEGIRARRDQSLCTFRIADTTAMMPHQHQSEHVIHPTTLDSIIQTAYPATKFVRSPMKQAMIPRSIKSLWISSDITRSAGALLHAYSYSLRQSSQRTEISVLVHGDKMEEDVPSTKPVVELGGLVLQALGATSTSLAAGARDGYEKYSAPKWSPDLALTPGDLLKSQLSCFAPADELEFMADLRKVCRVFLLDALAQLGPDDVRGLAGYRKQYYSWMKDQVEITPKGAVLRQQNLASEEALVEKVSRANVVGETVCRLGPNIPALLRNQITTLELLLRDELLERYYTNSARLRRSYQQLGQLVEHCIHKNPRAKILEIGAGTGAATMATLSALGRGVGNTTNLAPMAASYDFTDVSAGFFDAAKIKFGAWGKLLQFRKLDIEHDPSEQGFEPVYDLVIASQVLHATKSARNTMANVRRLMKPGGRLIMIETTQDHVDIHFIFGLFPEWWAGEEEERRRTPSLSIDSWDSVLRDTGFDGVDFEVHDCQDESSYALSVISSTVVESTQREPPRNETVIVLRDEGSTETTKWVEAVCHMILDETGHLPSIQNFQCLDVDGKACIYLGDLDNVALRDPDAATLEGIKSMCIRSTAVLWLTRGGAYECEHIDQAISWGFLRSIRTEFARRRLISFDLDPARDAWSPDNIAHLAKIMKPFLTPADTKGCEDYEYAERGGVIHTLRYTPGHLGTQPPLAEPAGKRQSFRAFVGTPGLLNTLSFVNDLDLHPDLPCDYLEMEPKAFGVNFRDVMVAMGQLPSESAMGFECAGVVTRTSPQAAARGFEPGDRIVALMKGSYATLVQTRWTSVVKIPDDLTFETAASIPMAFATAYIALFDSGRLEVDERVLIHAAAGGVGQAAIMLAKNAGAEIFATVSSQEKRHLLMEKYKIPADHIFSSRDASFGNGILSATEGQGVDVVLNSLSGTLLQEGLNCLSRFGRFVEIGKHDIEVNSDLEMSSFAHSATFTHVDLMQLQEYKGTQIQRAMTQVMRMYTQGEIEAVTPVIVYPLGQLEKMLRLMQAGKHVGKIVAKVTTEDLDPVPDQKPSAALHSNASYLIVGGLGALGQSICQWLAERGAKSLIILSRSSGKTGTISAQLQADMADLGCRVHLFGCNVSVKEELAETLSSCKASLPPIRGVIHAGMVLQDSILERMSVGDYKAAVQPKVEGSWHLHELLGDTTLDFFIMMSSLTGILGNTSQSNYTAGGAFQDALATHRIRHGLPGVSIDLSLVDSVGYAAEHDGVAERLSKAGYRVLSEEDVLEAVGRAVASPFQGQLLVGINTGAGSHWNEATMSRDSRFALLRPSELTDTAGKSTWHSAQQATGSKLGVGISEASALEEAAGIVSDAICKKIRNIFSLPEEEEIDVREPLTHYGVDSLVVVEIRNMLALEAGAEMSVFDMMQSPSISLLGSMVATKSSHLNSGLLQRA